MGDAGNFCSTSVFDGNRIAPCVIDIARDKVTGSVEYLVNVSGERAADDIIVPCPATIGISYAAQRLERIIRIAQDDPFGAIFINQSI